MCVFLCIIYVVFINIFTDQHVTYSCEIGIVDAGRHRRTPWTPARGGEWWMGLKSVDIDLILSNMLVGQWTVVRSVLDE